MGSQWGDVTRLGDKTLRRVTFLPLFLCFCVRRQESENTFICNCQKRVRTRRGGKERPTREIYPHQRQEMWHCLKSGHVWSISQVERWVVATFILCWTTLKADLDLPSLHETSERVERLLQTINVQWSGRRSFRSIWCGNYGIFLVLQRAIHEVISGCGKPMFQTSK